MLARLPLRRRHDVLLLEQVVKPAAERRQQLSSLLHQERPTPEPSVNSIAREAYKAELERYKEACTTQIDNEAMKEACMAASSQPIHF